MPTDFQLHRKNESFVFRFSLQWKNEIGLPFSFFIFPRREGNGIKIHLMLYVFLFLWLKKTDFNFLFRFRMEFWKRITIRLGCFVCRFLIEQKHTYDKLANEIKARHSNLKGCSLRSVKRFYNHQGIRKRMPVSEGALKCRSRHEHSSWLPVGKVFFSDGNRIFCRE